MRYQKTKNRINYLSREYSSTHLNSDEIVSKEYKKRINRNYLDNERIKIVNDVLYILPDYTASLLKENVYYMVKHYKLKDLCSRCPIETIIACIIIFVWKDYNHRVVVDKNKLWDYYDLSWEIYAKIMENLVRKMREEKSL